MTVLWAGPAPQVADLPGRWTLDKLSARAVSTQRSRVPPQIPADDVEATALALAEMMSPAKRRELARLLIRER